MRTKQYVNGTNDYIFYFILLSLSFFPIYFVIFSAFLMLYTKKHNTFVFIYVVIFFSILFYLRPYGISLGENAFDDVPAYLYAFSFFKDESFSVLFELPEKGVPFVEPFYWFVFYIVGIFSNFNDKVFLFMNFFISISIYLYALKKLFNNQYLFIYLFIIITGNAYLNGTVHILRQSFAGALILLALYFLSNNQKKYALLFMFIASLTHSTALVMLVITIFYIIDIKRIKFTQVILITTTLFILSMISLDGIVLKILFYTSQPYEGYTLVSILKNIILLVISVYFYFIANKKHDEVLKVLSFFLMVGFGMYILMQLFSIPFQGRLEIYFRPLFSITLIYVALNYFNNKNIISFLQNSFFRLLHFVRNDGYCKEESRTNLSFARSLIYISILLYIFLKLFFLSISTTEVTRFLLYENFSSLFSMNIFDLYQLWEK